MNVYLQLLFVTLIVVYVVDLSGFSQTVLDIASRVKGRRISSLKPLTCSLCMTWWVTLLVALCTKRLTLPVAAYCAALSFASRTLGDVVIFINEALRKTLDVLCRLFGL